MIFRVSSGQNISKKLLLLGTIGRKTGKVRSTPLQYEYFKNNYYLGSMRGKKSDWVKNIIKNPKVYIQLSKKRTFLGKATIIDDPEAIFLFLKLRITRNPRMLPIILSVAGVKDNNNPDSLRNYSKHICLVKVVIKKQL